MRRKLRPIVAIALAAVGWTSSAVADTYQYDAQGRVHQVIYSSGGVTTYNYDANGNILAITSSVPATAVEEGADAGFAFTLGQKTPNPGSDPMVLRFSIPSRGRVVLKLFSVGGRLVSTPLDATLDSGAYTTEMRTTELAAGVYFYRLEWSGKRLSRKLVLLR